MPYSRRDFFQATLAGQRKAANGNVLVCVFQRGAADGLNCVVPHGDADYYAKRTRIAIPPPGQSGGVLDLDGFFGLNPAAAPLLSLYTAGRLGFVHAVGMPHGIRSHFEAQALLESGVTSESALGDGWLGRHLTTTASSSDRPFRAVAISGSVPDLLRGADDPLAIAEIGMFGLGDLGGTAYQGTLDAFYPDDRPLAGVAQAALSAMDELMVADPGSLAPENGALYPSTEAGGKLLQAAQLIKADLGVEAICIDVGGWDHHENENDYLPTSLNGLARALLAFDTDLGVRMTQVTVLVLTEFGRRVADNVSKGTDHGSGALFYALGAGVNGGQVHGVWPGLSDAQLLAGEDLAITTDLRDLFIQYLQRRLGDDNAANLFPGHTPGIAPNLFL